MFKSIKRLAGKVGAATLALVGGMQAASAQTAYDGIVAAVDWADVITGVTAVGAALAAVYVVSRGTKMILKMIGR